MDTVMRVKYLRVALVAVGLIFIFGVYPLMMNYWPQFAVARNLRLGALSG